MSCWTKEELESKITLCLAVITIRLLFINMMKPDMPDEDIKKEYDGILNDCMSVFTRDR